MKPIIHIKEGLLGNLATIVFLLALSTFAVWLGHHPQHQYQNEESIVITWIFAGIMILCCYFPLDNIRHPKERTLSIEGDEIIWRIRGTEGGTDVSEERLSLRQIRRLQFVIPRDSATRARLLSSAELYFITNEGDKRELPLEFFPGVYRDKIVAAIREKIPDIQIEEIDNAA